MIRHMHNIYALITANIPLLSETLILDSYAIIRGHS